VTLEIYVSPNTYAGGQTWTVSVAKNGSAISGASLSMVSGSSGYFSTGPIAITSPAVGDVYSTLMSIDGGANLFPVGNFQFTATEIFSE
jgi:hypothetical protein